MQCPGYVQKLKWLAQPDPVPAAASAIQSPRAFNPIPTDTAPNLDDLREWLDMTPPPNMPDVSTQPEQEPAMAMPSERNWSTTPLPEVAFQRVLDFAELITPEYQEAQPSQQVTTYTKPSMLQSLGGRSKEVVPRPQASLVHQSTELLSYYFKYVSKLYAVYDDHRNPFRSVVSSMHSHSLVINLAAQSMAAACLCEVHPRFSTIGKKLRREAMDLIASQSTLDSRALLALMMFGPTGNWHDAKDLGLQSYITMRDRIDSMASSGELAIHEANLNSFNFFREAMIFWEMLLTYAVDSDAIKPCQTPVGPVITAQPAKYIAHPWTGVAREAVQLVADVGRLVRSHRLRYQTQSFITQAYVNQLNEDLTTARDLEGRLLACRHPDANAIVHPEDKSTPVWHLTTLAELYRYAGLLQIYRVFPDILSEKLQAENNDALMLGSALDESQQDLATRRKHWLTSFTLEALRLLETMPLESGTRDFQPFLLVVLSSELVCERPEGCSDPSEDDSVNGHFAEVAMMRKMVLDRLHACLRLLPPKPIRVCLDIVQETWKRIDDGQEDVYWLDVMIQNGWETIMA